MSDEDDFFDDDRRYDAEREAAEDSYREELREQFIPELYEEFANDVLSGKDHLYHDVIDQFTSERLQSFYIANPEIAGRALVALEEARALNATHPSASLVFAAVAIEVGLKTALLKPILHGLVSIDSTATLITRLVPDQHNDDFKKVLFGILKDVGSVDLLTFKRPSWKQALWAETHDIRLKRNKVIHTAELVLREDADHAIEVASAVLEDLFPQVISALGLKTDPRLRVSIK